MSGRRFNWSQIDSRDRMHRQGVEDIKGKTPLVLNQPPKQRRRKPSKAELREQAETAFLAWRKGQIACAAFAKRRGTASTHVCAITACLTRINARICKMLSHQNWAELFREAVSGGSLLQRRTKAWRSFAQMGEGLTELSLPCAIGPH
jgi:hypothetical protein